jgi:glutathione synthase/RimK-type ligase-like ATP-grasp enzyme
MGPDDVERLDRIRFCPVQFQAFVPGVDVRVHVVGDVVHASEITSDATDYRYAVRQTETPAAMRGIDLPGDVAARCIALAAGLGLEFAGIDLSFAEDGRVVCFEVNPSPAYSYFEAHTGQPIAETVARHLMRGESMIAHV